MSDQERPLRVLFAAAEASPFSKVGGLADVAGALPKALTRLGHDIRLITPRHATHGSEGDWPVVASFEVWRMGRSEQILLREANLGDRVPVYLVENGTYLGRPRVYGEPDDLERYLFFSQAALEAPKRLNWQPHVYHCNDWHTAPVTYGLRNLAWGDPFYAAIASLFTIHNLQYRGPDHLSDVMGPGIFHADLVSTVSETYAREILTPEYGEGLHLLLQLKQERLFGIVNGIDYDEFNPATDPHIPANYDATSLDKRAINKRALQERAGLPQRPEVPLFGMVSRLADQKGFDLLAQVLDPLFQELEVQFVLLGMGEEHYQRLLQEVAARYPGKACVFLAFDVDLAQLIYAGSDLFLMPSRFEPCGLGQLIALRYGSIPLVRHTGGLADTVQDCGPELDRGNGFVFESYEASTLLDTLRRATHAFQTGGAWHHLMVRAMAGDFSWEASARKYVALYRRAVELKANR